MENGLKVLLISKPVKENEQVASAASLVVEAGTVIIMTQFGKLL